MDKKYDGMKVGTEGNTRPGKIVAMKATQLGENYVKEDDVNPVGRLGEEENTQPGACIAELFGRNTRPGVIKRGKTRPGVDVRGSPRQTPGLVAQRSAKHPTE